MMIQQKHSTIRPIKDFNLQRVPIKKNTTKSSSIEITKNNKIKVKILGAELTLSTEQT